MNSKDAAALLGIDARVLRKFCRENPGYGKQIEGKWRFSKSDIALIRPHIAELKKPKRVNSSVEELSELQKRILSRRDPELNRQVTARYVARVERLEQRLRAAGVHLSQHRSDDHAG